MNRDAARVVLEMTCDILDSFGKTYWIDSGTVLSAYRDKDINIYDHDIDIRTIREEWSTGEVAELVKQLWLAGYVHINDTGDAWEQILGHHVEDVLLDFKFCHRDDKHVWYYCFTPSAVITHLYDRKYIDNIETIDLLGRAYPCPGPVEEYIETHYGPEWRLFKVRAEDAGETDLTWDFAKDPPICYTQEEFMALKGKNVCFARHSGRYESFSARTVT